MSTPPPAVPDDQDIIQQQAEIEREISATIPLITEKQPLSVLKQEYTSDPVYINKIDELLTTYESIRRTRPDGNCFFRAFCFGLLEALMEKEELREAFKEKIVEARQLLTDAGYTQFTVEDFYDVFCEATKAAPSLPNSTQLLADYFTEASISDYLVVFLRILTSAELRKNHEFYQNFLENGQTIEEFTQLEVEPMYKESDHLVMTALTKALDFGVRVVYMDRSSGGLEGSLIDFLETPIVHLLYRPGHYDLLYVR